MAFFVGERTAGRTTYYNINKARSIAHDQTSVDRSRWVFGFGIVNRTTVIVQSDSQRDAYDAISSYFSGNSTGV